MREPVTLYSTKWCGHCRRLKAQLERAGIRYLEIDLDEQPEHGPAIEQQTGGYRTVPSVEVGGRLPHQPGRGRDPGRAARLCTYCKVDI